MHSSLTITEYKGMILMSIWASVLSPTTNLNVVGCLVRLVELPVGRRPAVQPACVLRRIRVLILWVL